MVHLLPVRNQCLLFVQEHTVRQTAMNTTEQDAELNTVVNTMNKNKQTIVQMDRASTKTGNNHAENA